MRSVYVNEVFHLDRAGICMKLTFEGEKFYKRSHHGFHREQASNISLTTASPFGVSKLESYTELIAGR